LWILQAKRRSLKDVPNNVLSSLLMKNLGTMCKPIG
jgi:hypothetical protein